MDEHESNDGFSMGTSMDKSRRDRRLLDRNDNHEFPCGSRPYNLIIGSQFHGDLRAKRDVTELKSIAWQKRYLVEEQKGSISEGSLANRRIEEGQDLYSFDQRLQAELEQKTERQL